MEKENFQQEVIKESFRLTYYLTFKDLKSALPNDIDETEKEEFDDAIEKSAELVKKKISN